MSVSLKGWIRLWAAGSRAIFTVVALCLTSTALADLGPEGFSTGNGLYRALDRGNSSDFAMAMGYIIGVSDALDGVAQKNGFRFCIGNSGISYGQRTEVVKKWLRAHPEHWHRSAESLVSAAFDEAFPCAK